MHHLTLSSVQSLKEKISEVEPGKPWRPIFFICQIMGHKAVITASLRLIWIQVQPPAINK